MSLGVLNNLNAIYAENNLNKSSASLSTVLQQLSSGSKINSGADDAAGLSLVDGLEANSMALSQSKTNATEGVGLLTVADGALSQVTNLLNRAVTLATEASNGTLNTSQDTAANQEYQSILSEVSNIGSTTTYNDQAVFGTNTNIYTGDSSTVGASVDALNIGKLSSSNLGDTGGVMGYSNGQSSTFLNLSTSSSNAQATDTLTGGVNGSSTIDVNYLVKGANGAETSAVTSIAVGGSTGYANTANGLISAINNAGLGLTANFTTQAQAGVAGGGTQTGIQITGGSIAVGVDPNAAATSATLNPSSISDSNLTVGQTITVKTGTTTAASVTLTTANNTLAGLASAINSGSGGAGGVTATIVYNSANVATSLQIADNTDTGGALTVTSTAGGTAANPSGFTLSNSVAGAVGVKGSATLAISGTGSNGASQALSGSIVLANGTDSKTFVMGGTLGTSQDGNTITLGSGTSTLTTLTSAIAANLGATATLSSSGIAITSTATGTNITQGASTLTAALASSVTSNVGGMAATTGTDGNMTIAMTGDAMGITGNGSTTALATGTHISLTNGSGSTYTYTMSNAGSGNLIGTSTSTAALTAQSLVNAINSSTTTTGMNAQISNGAIVVGSTAVNTTIVASANNLSGTEALTATSASVAPVLAAVYSTFALTSGTGNPADNSLTTTGDSLSGTMTVANGNVTDTFIMGSSGTASISSGTYTTANATQASLLSAINSATSLGITASADDAAGATATGLMLTSNAAGTQIVVTNSGASAVTDTSTVGTDASGSVGSGAGQTLTTTLSADDGGKIAGNSVFSGSFVIGETGTGVNGGSAANLTVVVGNAAAAAGTTDATHLYIANGSAPDTMADIASKITTYIGTVTNTGGDNFDVTASVDANTGGLTIQAGHAIGTDSALSITAGAGSFTATQALATGSGSQGAVVGSAVDTVINTGTNLNVNDTLTAGTIIKISNTAGVESTDNNHIVTFTMGSAATAESGDGTTAVNVGVGGGYAGNTLGALVNAINSQTQMDIHASIVNGALSVTSTAASNAGTIGITGVNLTQAYGVGNVAGVNSGITTVAGGGPTAATDATVSINTTAGMNTAGTDPLLGSITLANSSNGTAITFNLNSSATGDATHVNLTSGANSTLNGLVSAINANATLGVTASINATTGALQIQSNTANTSITANSALTDATSEVVTSANNAAPSAESTANLNLTTGSLTENGQGDQLTGDISVSANGSITNYVMSGTTANNATFGNNGGTIVNLSAANSTVSGFAAALQANQGLTASVSAGTIALQSTSNNANAISITNNALSDTLGVGTTATLSVTAGSAYNLGVSNVATTGVYDSSTNQTVVGAGPNAASANLTANAGSGGGVATISYSDGAGQSLSATDLTNQTNAQTALNALNKAITDVAAQDGYIGAQINTLNSVSSVLSTQQENVTSAQNAVQATDYASATSNMSKYEILSQTGISALAQANSQQQMVTKLLQ